MPDVKQRLLQIVSHTDPMDAMDELLENLRCDHCKHWNEQYCDVADNSYDYSQSIRDVPMEAREWGECKAVLWTKPDFFCAAWEAKSA